MQDGRAELGQFFTPRAVIDFALAALAALGAELRNARICDPACGSGEWLRGALAAGAREALGIDCDPAMLHHWRRSGLSRDPRCLLAVGDGLDPGLPLTGRADLVLGNPPFGADLLDVRDNALRALAAHYRLPRLNQPVRLLGCPSSADCERLRRFPTELLFLERFVEICRPGGWIAIVLPEGVLANARWRRVRSWLLARLTVHLVAALPRATFRAHATTARTCLALLRHHAAPPGHQTRLCAVDDCAPETLDALLEMLVEPSSEPVNSPLDLTPPIFLD